MATLDMTATLSKPSRILPRPWEAYLEALGRNSRDLSLDGCTVEPISNVVMLSPKYEGDAYDWGKDHWDLSAAADFMEAQDMFGVGGTYLSYAGNVSAAWWGFLNSSTKIEADRGMVFNIFWQPAPDAIAPSLEFFPRVDLSKYATINGYTYYFAPFILTVDTQANLTVYEYEFDNYTAFEADPSRLLERTYQHSLLLGPNQLNQQFLSLTIIPIENDGFALLSPQAKDGGFAYYSKLSRETLKLFPEGSAGVRSLSGGLSTFNIVPLEWPTSGTVIGPKKSKREEDTNAVTVTVDSWEPAGTDILAVAVDPDTGDEITPGASFRDYACKLTFTGDGKLSPILYYVKSEVTGEGEDKTPDTTDISDDVIITEETSEDLVGYRATVRLRNRDGAYNELVYRPLNEIDFDLLGVDRAILYTLEPEFIWWQTPTQEALWLEWQCGDGWVRLTRTLVGNEIAYDGLDLKTAVETFLERQGWDGTKIDVHADAADIILPSKRGSNEYQFKPENGSAAADFLRDLWEKFCSTWEMYVGGDGTFYLQPVSEEVERTYYLSKTEADAAYAEDYDAWMDEEVPPEDPDYDDWVASEPDPDDYGYWAIGGVKVRMLHEQFANEIWVLGWDDATQRPLAAMYLDALSQSDEDYLYYTGDRRMIVLQTQINRQDTLQWICDRLATYYGRVRRQIEFKAKADPTMRPGTIITFDGTELTFRVLSTHTEVGPNTWGRNTGNVYENTIQALEWPV